MAVELLPVLKKQTKGSTPVGQKSSTTYYFRKWHTRITAEEAEKEPANQRLFKNS